MTQWLPPTEIVGVSRRALRGDGLDGQELGDQGEIAARDIVILGDVIPLAVVMPDTNAASGGESWWIIRIYAPGKTQHPLLMLHGGILEIGIGVHSAKPGGKLPLVQPVDYPLFGGTAFGRIGNAQRRIKNVKISGGGVPFQRDDLLVTLGRDDLDKMTELPLHANPQNAQRQRVCSGGAQS